MLRPDTGTRSGSLLDPSVTSYTLPEADKTAPTGMTGVLKEASLSLMLFPGFHSPDPEFVQVRLEEILGSVETRPKTYLYRAWPASRFVCS
jgi:hypothetical protein